MSRTRPGLTGVLAAARGRAARGRTARGAALVALAAVLVLPGCTVGGDPEEQSTQADGQESPPAPVGSDEPEPEDTPTGPTPEELSAELLAGAGELPEPLGAVSAVIPPADDEATMEVLEIRPVDGATYVLMRLTSPGEPFNVGPNTFSDGRFGTQNFVRDIYLDDVAGGTRYLPLQFVDYRDACVCPYKPLELGPEPQLVTALFPALPEGTATVDVRLASTELALTGLPVG